jgi:hypothetical protein
MHTGRSFVLHDFRSNRSSWRPKKRKIRIYPTTRVCNAAYNSRHKAHYKAARSQHIGVQLRNISTLYIKDFKVFLANNKLSLSRGITPDEKTIIWSSWKVRPELLVTQSAPFHRCMETGLAEDGSTVTDNVDLRSQ